MKIDVIEMYMTTTITTFIIGVSVRKYGAVGRSSLTRFKPIHQFRKIWQEL